MKLQRVLPGLGLGIVILILGPLHTHYRFEYQAAGLLGLALLGAVWLVIASLRGGRIAASPLDVPLSMLVIAFTIASAVSLDPRRSLGQVQLLLGHVLLFWIVFDLLSRDEPQASSLKPQVPPSVSLGAGNWRLAAWTFGLLLVSGVVLLLAIAEVESWYLSWWNLGGAAHPLPPFSYRLTSWLGHSSGFSALIAACAPLAIISLILSRRPVIRITHGLWLMGALVGFVFASSRAGWLALGTGLAISALLWNLWHAGARAKQRRGTGRGATGATLEQSSGIGIPGSGVGGVRTARTVRSRAGRWLLGAGCSLVLAAIAWLAIRQFQDPTHSTLASSRAALWPPAWSAFLSSPVVGTGPATYYRHYLAANPLGQHTFLTQAHSVLFSLLAEEGLIGIAAAGAVVISALAAALRGISAASAEERPWSIAALGGLAALGVHALTDNAASTPPVSFVLVLLAALALRPASATKRTRPAWIPALLLLPILGFGAYTLPGQLAFRRGLAQSAGGDAAGSAAAFHSAAQADPSLAWYSLEAGFAHALSAQNEPSLFPAAISDFEAGIGLDPEYAVHWLNLAWVYWQSGDRATALDRMSVAAELDSSSPLIQINLGWMLEATVDHTGARRAYRAALDGDSMQSSNGYAVANGSLPDLSNSLFWDSNEVRRRMRNDWDERNVTTPYVVDIMEGSRWLEEGQPGSARASFEQALALDRFRAEAYRGLGLTAALEGIPEEARYYLLVAALGRGVAFERTRAWLDLMELEADQDRPTEAIDAGRRGFELLEFYNSWGIGSDHANPYAWGVFYRESLPDDLLPWVLRPDLSGDLAHRLLLLARLLDFAGDQADACRVIQRVLRAAPEYEPALFESEHLSCGP